MSTSVEERVVSMAFENAKFEAAVAQTLATLAKLEEAIKKVGVVNGFAQVEMASQKVTFNAPMSALDKLKAKLSFGSTDTQGLASVETASQKVTLATPMSALDKLKAKLGRTATEDAPKLQAIENEGRKISLSSPLKTIGKVTAAVAGIGAGAVAGFRVIESAADKVGMAGIFRTVDKLQSRFTGINFTDTAASIERAADRVSMDGLSKSIDGIKNQFSILEGAAAVALGNIATQALQKGKAFASSFTIDPIKAGFEEFGTNMGSIQTILANTEGQKGSGLDAVNAHLQELNHYSDQTIYNFSEMAKNIGTFTAAGVDLDKSTSSIKGIANLAAMSGSNSQQASTAMYQLSQAISSGKVGLQDWNSVVNAGMGGAVFQKALMKTADNMGTLEEGAVKIDKATGKATVNGQSFRDSIMAKPGQKSWLSSEVLVQTLENFTGDLSKADIMAQGFSAHQAEAIMKQAETAKKAATEVKTLSGVFDVVKESIGSGWAATFQNIFGDFEESKKLFTDMTSAITGFVGKHSDARNKVLAGWKELGGRTAVLDGLKAAFAAFASVVKPIGAAFREIFPAKTAKDLYAFSIQFREFMVGLKIGKGTAEDLKRTFAGVFAVLHIGWTIVKQLFGVVGDLFGMFGEGSGGILEFTGNLGDFLVQLDKAISSGHAMDAIFGGLTTTLAQPIALLKKVGDLIRVLFAGGVSKDGMDVETAMEAVQSKLGPLGDVIEKVSDTFKKFGGVLQTVKKFLDPIFSSVVNTISNIGQKISDAFDSMDMESVMLGFQTALTGGIFLAIKKAIGGGIDVSFFKGLTNSVTDSLDALNGSLKAIQTNIKSNTLLQIAIAVGALAAGVYVLSTINPKDLSKAMTAVAVGLGELVGAMKLMTGIGGVRTLPVIAGSMILLATALDILAIAVFAFSRLSWEELAKGLVGVGGALAAMMPGLSMLSGMSAKLIITAPALIAVAIAMNIMAVAVKIFGSMDWAALGKGMLGLAVTLDIVSMGLRAMGPSLSAVGPGLLMMAGGMVVLALAFGLFGSMSLVTMAKGILGMTGALTVLAWAISGFPPNLIFAAAGLVVLGGAMGVIATAVGLMGSMRVGTLVKGLLGLGAALGILAVGLYLMIGTLPGAFALLAAATALAVLGPALAFMGVLPWGVILKGLAAMALSLGVIAIVGLAAAPALAAIGVAFLALGIGIAVLSTGVYILAKGLSLLGSEGTKGIAVMVAAITAFVALIPKILIDFVKGLVGVIAEIAKVAPKVALALGVVIDSLLDTVIHAAPKLAIAAGSLIDAFLVTIVEKGPKIIEAGIGLLVAFLSGVDKNIDTIVKRATSIVLKFFTRMAAEGPKMVKSGASMLVAFLKGISDNLPRVLNHATRVVLTFLEGLAVQLPKMVRAGTTMLVKFLNSIAEGLPRVIRAGTNMVVAFLEGIGNSLPRIVESATTVATKFIRAVGKNAPRIADAGFKALVDFLEGLAKAIRENNQDLLNAGLDIAKAIVDGIVNGLGVVARRVVKPVVEKLFDLLPGFAKKLLGIKSPSTVFHAIGENVMYGMANGLTAGSSRAVKSLGNVMGKILSVNKDVKTFGKFLGGDFMDAVSGGFEAVKMGPTQEKVLGGMKELHGKINEERAKFRDQIKADKDKIKQLEDEDKPNVIPLQKARAALAAHEALLKASGLAGKRLLANLGEQQNQQLKLAGEFDDNVKLLEDAQKTLDDLKQQRDDYIKQYNTPPDFTAGFDEAMAKLDEAELSNEERAQKRKDEAKAKAKRDKIDQVALYKKALEEQIAATKKYNETLTKLRELGLDDSTYKRLLAEGPKDQGFADQLLRSGKNGILGINELDKQLLTESTKMANDATDHLFKTMNDVGIKAAEGIVQGLKDRQVEIQEQMNVIGAAMVASIKRQLGIKSPSRVMMEVGKFTAQGVIAGLNGSAQAVASAAAGIGDTAATAMSENLAHISDALSAEIDPDLTITPVLDLSQVQKDAKRLGDLTNVTPITAAASFGQASAISDDVAITQAARDEAGAAGINVSLEQNNYSPEALSDVEIYRQTKNQLSQVKSALGLAS